MQGVEEFNADIISYIAKHESLHNIYEKYNCSVRNQIAEEYYRNADSLIQMACVVQMEQMTVTRSAAEAIRVSYIP